MADLGVTGCHMHNSSVVASTVCLFVEQHPESREFSSLIDEKLTQFRFTSV